MKQRMAVAVLLVVLAFPLRGFCLDASVQVDRNRLSENESLVLKVIVDGEDAEVDPSPITDFRVMPRGTSTNVSIVNGKYSKTITHTFVLMPLKSGTLIIPSLEVTGKSGTFRSDPITITVSNLPEQSRETGDLFAKARLSATRMVVGQQAIYTFQLFSAVPFSNARLQGPGFEGFSAREAKDRKTYTRVINGKSYDVTEIQYVIVPGAPGTYTIPPAAVVCDIPVGGSGDPFGGSLFGNRFFSMGRTRTLQVKTEGFQVTVNPLPPYGGDTAFSGLVGKFSVGAGLDRTDIQAGESVTLTVTVSGTGNVMDAQVPVVAVPDGFKAYDDTPEQTLEITPSGYTGEKIFKKALVPVGEGIFELPPVRLSYFDIDANDYALVSTPPMTLTVRPSDEKTSIDTGGIPQGAQPVRDQKQSVEVTGHDILALKQGAQVLVSRPGIPVGRFGILMVIPCLVFFLVRLAMRFSGKQISVSRVMARRAEDNLRQAKNPGVSREDFLKHLYRALVSAVMSRAGVQGESLTEQETAEILAEAGCSSEDAAEVRMLLNDIEQARYSRAESDSAERQQLLQRVGAMVKTIGLLLLLSLAFLSATGVAKAEDDSGTQFLRGVQAYDTGSFEDAARLFQSVAASGVSNGDLYYNIGNAWLKAGQNGKAILWYERALKMIPQDPDLRFNLAYADSFIKDRQDEDRLDLTDLVFFWRGYLSSNALQLTALIACYAFFLYAGFRTLKKKRIFTIAGGVFFALSVLVAATALFDYHQQYFDCRAVVIADEAPVRSGFSEDSTRLFFLHAGTRVRVERVQEGYLRIYFSQGKIGWIKKGDAEII